MATNARLTMRGAKDLYDRAYLKYLHEEGSAYSEARRILECLRLGGFIDYRYKWAGPPVRRKA
jgi:hypothetical protein